MTEADARDEQDVGGRNELDQESSAATDPEGRSETPSSAEGADSDTDAAQTRPSGTSRGRPVDVGSQDRGIGSEARASYPSELLYIVREANIIDEFGEVLTKKNVELKEEEDG